MLNAFSESTIKIMSYDCDSPIGFSDIARRRSASQPLTSTLAILGQRKLPSIPAFFGAEIFQP